VVIYKVLQFFSAGSHLLYGVITLLDPFYEEEFIRYGFSEYRILIALSQLLAGIGLFLGFYNIRFKQYSAAVLSIMMIGAFITRIVIHDSVIQSSPAFLYMCINSIIFLKSLNIKK